MGNREELDTDSMRAERTGATRGKTALNRFEVLCGECGQACFVDEGVARSVEEAQAYEPSEISFRCEDCEAEYFDRERGM
jgi:hypothetical protein